MFYNILFVMTSLILLMFLGYILKYFNILKYENAKPLSKLVFYITIPCLFFLKLDTSTLQSFINFPITFIAILSGIITGLIAFSLYTLLKIDKVKKWSVLITVTFGQTTFMGLILLSSFNLETHLVIFFEIGSYIIILFLSIFLMIKFTNKKGISHILKKIITFPVLWGIVLGFIFGILDIDIGPVMNKILNYLADMTIPLMWIVFGLSLDFKTIKNNFILALSASILKILVFPLIAFSFVSLLNIEGIVRNIIIIDSLVPCGILNIVLANDNNLDDKLAAASIFLSTIIGFITIPILSFFLA